MGFIGQGWIGKNYADNFEERGYAVIRYSLDEKYHHDKNSIPECDIVFIAVPTPTTSNGFDDSQVREVVKLIGHQKIAVIKSTMIPGTTESIQRDNKHIFIMHCPEFLAEKTAKNDTCHPSRTIIGIPIMNDAYKGKAELVLSILPISPIQTIVDAKSAELIKYLSNSFLLSKVVFFNIAYDLVEKFGLNFEDIRSGVVADPRIGESHSKVIDASGHAQNKPGRGAGGHCFIKDFEAYLSIHKEMLGKDQGYKTLLEIRNKNIELLRTSEKDTKLLEAIFTNKQNE